MEMTVLVQCRDDWFREQERAVYLIETRHVNIDFSLLKFSLIDRNIERGENSASEIFRGGDFSEAEYVPRQGQMLEVKVSVICGDQTRTTVSIAIKVP